MQLRIVERTCVNGDIKYVIQLKHWLFRCWVDAQFKYFPYFKWCESHDNFYSLEEARNHLCYFDGTKTTDRVVAIGTAKKERKRKRIENSY